MAVRWLDATPGSRHQAAIEYLSMVEEPGVVKKTVAALKHAKPVYRLAKDILRAVRLDMLPATNAHVAGDPKKISDGSELSPILLVRGSRKGATAPQIADGYHRVSAAYFTDENTPIPFHLVSWQS